MPPYMLTCILSRHTVQASLYAKNLNSPPSSKSRSSLTERGNLGSSSASSVSSGGKLREALAVSKGVPYHVDCTEYKILSSQNYL